MGLAVALNFLIPLVAESLPLLIILRITIGLCEAGYFPAATQCKLSERNVLSLSSDSFLPG